MGDRMDAQSSNLSSDPAVTVILPAHNRADLLPRAAASVLDQDFRDLRLIIVDDGSTDRTPEVATGLCGDPRVQYVRFERNRGQSAARNHGLALARSPFVAFQDSDDAWMPGKLRRQMDILAGRPDLDLVYGHLLRIPRRGEPFIIRAPQLVRGRLFDDRPSIYASFGIGIQTCLFRTGALQRIQGFNEHLACMEDLELFLRFNVRYRSLAIEEPLVRYYETGGVITHNTAELATRRFLLHRHGWRLLLSRPRMFMLERRRIRSGKRMDI